MDESLAKASLLDGYRVAGFRVRARIKSHVRDPTGLVITLALSRDLSMRRVFLGTDSTLTPQAPVVQTK
jgi:hypothetical protein